RTRRTRRHGRPRRGKARGRRTTRAGRTSHRHRRGLPMSACIDLRERWGGTYRPGLDPAADTPLGRADPWLVTMPGRRGTIYPHGGGLLAVEIDYRPGAARRLAALPGVTLAQDGEREKTFTFPAGLFGQVAAIVLPRRRRRLSAEHKA